MEKLTISQQRELLDLYDQLYRLGSTPLWHTQRQRGGKDYDIFVECYDKFTREREIAACELGIMHYEARLAALS